MKVTENANKKLKRIFSDKSLTPEDRGNLGEELVLDLIKYWVPRNLGTFFHSYIYPQGEILPTTSVENPVTEADVIVITDYRIFVIEVKTVYGNLEIMSDCSIKLTRKGKEVKNAYSYLRQNEMHARHLYYHLHKLLPKGDPSYIIPLVVLVGNMSVKDYRDKYLKIKYPVIPANRLITTLDRFNKPKDFLLNKSDISTKLKNIRVRDKGRLLESQKFKENLL